MVSGAKNVLKSAVLIFEIIDDVIVTSRDVMMLDVNFFGFKSFLSLISNFCPSFKSIEYVEVKLCKFPFM